MRYCGLLIGGLILSLGTLSACTHVQGVVIDSHDRPVTGAEFTVGHPNGLGSFSSHKVGAKGDFDFWIVPTDENHLYVWDGRGDSLLGPRKVDRSEISDHMRIVLRRSEGSYE